MTIDVSQCKQTSDLRFGSSSTVRTPSRQDENNHRKRTRSKRKSHYRNTITVRQISSQDMIAAQRLGKTRCIVKSFNPPHKRRKAIYETPPLTKVQMSSRQTINRILPDELSTIKNKDMNSLKVIPLRDLSNVSLEPSTLHVVSDEDNQLKEDAVHSASKLVIDNAPRQLTSTNSSIVPHFSSTIAPHVPLQTSSSTIIMPRVLAKESNTPLQSRSLHDNIQDLVDQLKACLVTLNLLIQNREDRERSTKKRNRPKKRPLNPSANLRRQARPHTNKDPLLSIDLNIKPCMSRDLGDKNLGLPSVYHSQHADLQRCLLIYNRSQIDRHRC